MAPGTWRSPASANYEVRLVEAAPERKELSLELHDHFRRVVVDSVHREDLEVAEVFSEEMILWAHELQSKSEGTRISVFTAKPVRTDACLFAPLALPQTPRKGDAASG